MKIWEKYFTKEFFKIFFLFLICFYGMYVLIDYTNRAGSFHYQSRFQWSAFFTYYAGEFVIRSEVLIPFAILLGTIRTLCKLNQSNELIAMMASGIRMTTLLRPFLMIGLFFTLLMYFNNEYLLPVAAKQIKYLDDVRTSEKNKSSDIISVQNVALEDNSTLLFQSYDTVRNLFFDAYWIRSADEIYRIKYLYPYTNPPTGHFVNRLVRDTQGRLIAIEEKAIQSFPEIRFNPKTLIETITLPEDLSLSELSKKIPKKAVSEKEARALSSFHRKIASPWLCLLAVLAPAPFCVRFSRHFPIFFVYALSIFGLVGIYLVMDASHVLARRQVFDPVWAIWTPLVAFLLVFSWRFARVR